MGGGSIVVATTVIDTYIWACDGEYVPEIHTIEGVCTAKGKGYTYGFAVDRKDISTGFSGGGAYDSAGALLGIVVQTGIDNSGRDIAFLYFIYDLQKDLKF